MDTIASRLRHARTVRGVGSRELSALAGLSPAAVAYLETHPDESPKVRTVEALARALGCDPAWLAFGAPYPAP